MSLLVDSRYRFKAPAHRALSIIDLAVISLAFVFVSADLGQAQTAPRHADQGQVSKGSQHANQGQVRKGSHRADQDQVRKGSHRADQGQVRKGSRRAAQRDARNGRNGISPRVSTQGSPNQYDGSWTVSVQGGAGICQGHSLTYAVQIRNGQIFYGGGDGSVSGRVSPSGAAFVRVVSGDRSGTGSGRMSSRASGSGTFQGQAGGSPCSGSWRAGRA
jgi:hypothetical protein